MIGLVVFLVVLGLLALRAFRALETLRPEPEPGPAVVGWEATQIQRAVDAYVGDRIDVATLEARVAAALDPPGMPEGTREMRGGLDCIVVRHVTS